MNSSDMSDFLKLVQYNPAYKTGPDKLKAFVKWCKDNNKEEVILRLSSKKGSGFVDAFTIDFTNLRIIATKKKILKKLVDFGFVAGMAPIPYIIITAKKEPNFSDVKRQPQVSDLVVPGNVKYVIDYSEIAHCHIRRGIETTVKNMFGTFARSNFLDIKTDSGKLFSFNLPANKNGDIEKTFYWIKTLIPNAVLI